MRGGGVELMQQVMAASHAFCTTVNDMLERSLDEVSEERLMLSQVELLLLIARPGRRLNVTDVAEFLGVTRAAASRSVDRLVRRGLIDRTASQEDRRAVVLALTPESEGLLARFEEVRTRELLRVLGDFPPEKMRAVVSLLDELAARLGDLKEGKEEGLVSVDLYAPPEVGGEGGGQAVVEGS